MDQMKGIIHPYDKIVSYMIKFYGLSLQLFNNIPQHFIKDLAKHFQALILSFLDR